MQAYDSIKSKLEQIADIQHAIAVLSWDKEVMMPDDGALFRSRQIATLSELAHEKFTSDVLGKELNTLKTNSKLNENQKINIERLCEDYEKARKLNTEFVRRSSLAISQSYHAWIKARKASDYALFENDLATVLEIKREEAELRTYENHPYNALLDSYESGMTVDVLDKVFGEVKTTLVPLAKKIVAHKKSASKNVFVGDFPKDKQWLFANDIVKKMGYDFNAGRHDESTHPFTISFSPQDVRITTRIDESEFSYMFWSSIHEAGHALYEQGLKTSEYGMPIGEAASLSIHESQSRLWENQVARSEEFWQHYFPQLKTLFPAVLNSVSFNEFYAQVNNVEPNLIRTEADELHYHLHILVRFEIEKGIMEGKYNASNLPETWNRLYKEYLGISASNPVEGILQDIHWSHGSIGYFPTYSLGSFYAAQFYEQAEKDLGNLPEQIAAAKFKPLLNWLRKNVHVHGRKYLSEDLCKKITGNTLSLDPFVKYAKKKYSAVYQMNNL